MKDMTTVLNKKIVSKETNEVRLVVKIDEENRKIFSVPVDEPAAEPSSMAAASYDRRWHLCEEPAAEPQVEEPKTEALATEGKPEPMKMSETITALETIFDKLNAIYFEGKLPRPVITVQTTPKAYGHCSTKKIWKSENEGTYEINLGAEFINRPKESACATLLHEMVHLFCTENEIADTCQNGRYHNKTFKVECEIRDLIVEYDHANGYAHTSPTDAFKAKLAEAGVDLSVRFARVMPKAKAKAEREKAHRYVCPVCGREARTTSELSLICGHCNVTLDRLDEPRRVQNLGV